MKRKSSENHWNKYLLLAIVAIIAIGAVYYLFNSNVSSGKATWRDSMDGLKLRDCESQLNTCNFQIIFYMKETTNIMLSIPDIKYTSRTVSGKLKECNAMLNSCKIKVAPMLPYFQERSANLQSTLVCTKDSDCGKRPYFDETRKVVQFADYKCVKSQCQNPYGSVCKDYRLGKGEQCDVGTPVGSNQFCDEKCLLAFKPICGDGLTSKITDINKKVSSEECDTKKCPANTQCADCGTGKKCDKCKCVEMSGVYGYFGKIKTYSESVISKQATPCTGSKCYPLPEDLKECDKTTQTVGYECNPDSVADKYCRVYNYLTTYPYKEATDDIRVCAPV